MPERPPRTLLELRIRERCLTLEEFIEYAERFARNHHEPGTLSLRHLQRLIAGQQTPSALRPATARLLERIFGEGTPRLLGPPTADETDPDSGGEELRRMLDTARRVDTSVIELLHKQLDGIRGIDRHLGAVVAGGELNAKIQQVTRLMKHSLTQAVRQDLAALLSEMHTLAGWQALDTAAITESWSHYDVSKSVAIESGSIAYASHAAAAQALVLLDLRRTHEAVEILGSARQEAERKAPRVLRSWLAAAHGEALAANGQQFASLLAFDRAAGLLPTSDTTAERPYVALDLVDLTRWRGHGLALLSAPEAVSVLTDALARLNRRFTRAHVSVRVDLVTAHLSAGERSAAQAHAARARVLAEQLGSTRHQRRLRQCNSINNQSIR